MSYIVLPNMLQHAESYWTTRRYKCIRATFEDFMVALDQRLDAKMRSLAVIAVSIDHPLRRQLSVDDFETAGSQELWNAIDKSLLYVHEGDGI